jgi:lipopolysaccharide export system permease protein
VNLLNRYILRETFFAFLLVTFVLFVILMSNQFAEILDDAATSQLPKDAVFAVFSLTSLQYITFLTPIGLFLGIMLALARFNRDSEMAAMASCGVGPVRLLGPISVLTVLLAATVAWLALVRTPDASRQIEEIKIQAREDLEIGVLESGVFTSPDSGDTIVYAQDVAGDEIYDVFIEHKDGDRVIVILAERGERRQNDVDGQLTFVLYNGRRYEGIPGEESFRIIEFGEHGMPVRVDQPEEEQPVETKSVEALLASSAPEDRAELQWRLSAPFSLFVLALVAVPLSRSRPREGRYARLGVGILVYIIYANMLNIARSMVEQEEVPQWIGMWWAHLVLGLIGLTLLARESGWFARSPAEVGT